MNVLISINSDYQDFLNGKHNDYSTGFQLIQCFQSRGHSVRLFHPADVVEGRPVKLFKIDESTLRECEPYFEADYLFVRHLGENEPCHVSQHFVTEIPRMLKDIPCTLNPGDSTKYQVKDHMYSLDLPFIPQIHLENANDLKDALIEYPKGIIIKPIVGMLGYGVEYIQGQEDISRLINDGKLTKQRLLNSIICPFIPANIESRYIFHNGHILLNSLVERRGKPGREQYGQKKLSPLTNKREIEIVKTVIEITGWRFGSVDFRGGSILEIHGSSTGTVAYTSIKNKEVLYDLNDYLVDQCEKDFELFTEIDLSTSCISNLA